MIKTVYMKTIFNISVFVSFLLVFLCTFSILDNIKFKYYNKYENITNVAFDRRDVPKIIQLDDDYNVWLIFTKVIDKSPLMYNFKNLITNLLNVSSIPLHFNIFVDSTSESLAKKILIEANTTDARYKYSFYDVTVSAKLIEDIVHIMTPHFSSRPGTYYSDSLFYLSLGLYRIAPIKQKQAVMLDCDLYFKDDIVHLFKEINRFGKETLFGLAPELTPVYRHVLYSYKLQHNTSLGDYYHEGNITTGLHPKGFQGYNSGVILFDLSAIRRSSSYNAILSKEFVDNLANKYSFKGHLGDQDFYTLLGFEKPELFRTLNCGLNRQLCTWWRDHGYNEIFYNYFKCKHKVIVLHGNCNTRIPK